LFIKIDALMDWVHNSDMTGDKEFLSSETLSSRLCQSFERVPNSVNLSNVSQTVQVCRTCPKQCKSTERVPNSASLPNVSQTHFFSNSPIKRNHNPKERANALIKKMWSELSIFLEKSVQRSVDGRPQTHISIKTRPQLNLQRTPIPCPRTK
jgi:hypothetical protein